MIYQRSVAKMFQMETLPGRLIDPHWTALPEAGREGTYYLDLKSYTIRRSAVSYQLPRGGIL